MHANAISLPCGQSNKSDRAAAAKEKNRTMQFTELNQIIFAKRISGNILLLLL
jgi:hypothetical protein